MAVIMKLRDKFGIIIVGAIIFVLALFVLQAALDPSTSPFKFSNKAGVINGTSIDIQDYQRKVSDKLEMARTQGQSDISDQTLWSTREQVWNEYVEDIVMGEKYKKLGVLVSDKEMTDMFQGSNPHPLVVQSFRDPETGQYDPASVSLRLQEWEERNDSTVWRQWDAFRDYLKKDRLTSKFNALARKAMYVPSWEANERYNLNGTTVDFDYVYLPYSEILDADVQVTESELNKYLSEHKAKYQQEESRTIQFVSFDILPTTHDTLNVRKKLEEDLENFKTTDNDSIFLKLYSDKPFDAKYYSREDLASSLKDTFFSIDTSVVIGPYLEEGSWIFAKLTDRKLIPDSVKARHIFLSIAGVQNQEEVEALRKKADSLLTQLKGGADFGAFVRQYTNDESTMITGGDWGWIKPGDKFGPINDALFFRKSKGDMFMLGVDDPTPGNAGFHIIEITEATPSTDAVQVAFLTQPVLPSRETERALYDEAKLFVSTHSTADSFKAASGEYLVRTAENLKKNDYTIQGLGEAREIVYWAYNAKENDVSIKVYDLPDKYVVVMLANVKDEGTASLDDVKAEVEVAVKKEKKAEMLKEKIKGQTDLNAIAGSTGKEVKSAAGMTLTNSFIPEAGLEMAVVGKALTMTQGETSGPIIGENGVFVIRVSSKVAAPALTNITAEKKRLTQLSIPPQFDMTLAETIRKTVKIKDERYKYYQD